LRDRPCSSAKLASAICPRVAVVPLLNDPVMVPSEPILKLCKVPLAVPSCSMDRGAVRGRQLGDHGVVPLSTFQLKVWLLAPSANPEMLAVISVGGVAAAPVPCVSEIRFPFPSNVNVPVCRIPVAESTPEASLKPLD